MYRLHNLQATKPTNLPNHSPKQGTLLGILGDRKQILYHFLSPLLSWDQGSILCHLRPIHRSNNLPVRLQASSKHNKSKPARFMRLNKTNKTNKTRSYLVEIRTNCSNWCWSLFSWCRMSDIGSKNNCREICYKRNSFVDGILQHIIPPPNLLHKAQILNKTKKKKMRVSFRKRKRGKK